MEDGNRSIDLPLTDASAQQEPCWPRPGYEIVPDHELLRRIGRGGYGEVWLARNKLGIYRAVKIVSRKSFDEQAPFEREWSGIRLFEPLSRSHEGFVDILQVGMNEERGYFYYVMELADDRNRGSEIDPENYLPKTLAKEVKSQGKLPVRDCMALGMALSLALSELHKHNLVHRDVKPSNIVFVNGVPKLADIGLVTDAREGRSYVGTEGFIPPEGPGMPQADVYSLGKVLYECSTGKDRQDFPDLPSTWAPTAEHEALAELNHIILKACKPNPAERYQSAWEMHAHLTLLASGRSVHRLISLETTFRNLKRLALIGAAAILVVLPVIFLLYRESQRSKEIRQQQVGASIANANHALESGDLLGALPHFAEGMKLEQGRAGSARDYQLRFGSTLAQCPRLVQVLWTGSNIVEAHWTQEGHRIFCAHHFGKARIYELHTGRQLGEDFGPPALCGGAWSPDGSRIATASEAGFVSVWDSTTLKEILHLPHSTRVNNVRFSSDGTYIVAACRDGLIQIWDATNGTPAGCFKGHSDDVLIATFSPDGRFIASAGTDKTVRLWDFVNRKSLLPPLEHPSWVTHVAFSPDGRKLITSCADNRARVWQTTTGQQILPDLVHRDCVTCAEFSPDGQLILTASLEGAVRLWRAKTLQPYEILPVLRQGDRVTFASFDPTGRLILTAGSDGSLFVWDLAGTVASPAPTDLFVNPDGNGLVTLSNNPLGILDFAKKTAMAGSSQAQARFINLQRTANGALVLVTSAQRATRDGTNQSVQVWNMKTGKPLGPAVQVPGAEIGAMLSSGGDYMATWSGTRVQIWNVAQGKTRGGSFPHRGPVTTASLSPDASVLATACGNAAFLWKSTDPVVALKKLEHSLLVSHVSFSADGKRLVTCCADQQFTKSSAQAWDVNTGQRVGGPLEHRDGVLYATFSPDRSRIATASEDFTAAVWDAVTGSPLTPLLAHLHQVQGAAFSPDSRWVATASKDRTARIWSGTTGDPLTPPLHQIGLPEGVQFTSDGKSILIIAGEHAWLWSLPMEKMPPEDTIRFARLLSGGRNFPPRTGSGKHTETVRDVWLDIQTRYPEKVSVSGELIQAWEAAQAAECEASKEWLGAAHHLQQLIETQPNQSGLRERLARARSMVSSSSRQSRQDQAEQ